MGFFTACGGSMELNTCLCHWHWVDSDLNFKGAIIRHFLISHNAPYLPPPPPTPNFGQPLFFISPGYYSLKMFFVCFILAGPNLIFFNERARGLPSGIVLGQTSRPCVSLDTGLTSAKLHYLGDLSPQTVKRIEVSKRLWFLMFYDYIILTTI